MVVDDARFVPSALRPCSLVWTVIKLFDLCEARLPSLETGGEPDDDNRSIATAVSSAHDYSDPNRPPLRYTTHRRAMDPPTFGWFQHVDIHDHARQAQACQGAVDFFEQLQGAGFLYQGFMLGYDRAGNVRNPARAHRASGGVQMPINTSP